MHDAKKADHYDNENRAAARRFGRLHRVIALVDQRMGLPPHN